jgi:hypothetical protein
MADSIDQQILDAINSQTGSISSGLSSLGSTVTEAIEAQTDAITAAIEAQTTKQNENHAEIVALTDANHIELKELNESQIYLLNDIKYLLESSAGGGSKYTAALNEYLDKDDRDDNERMYGHTFIFSDPPPILAGIQEGLEKKGEAPSIRMSTQEYWDELDQLALERAQAQQG